jgi:hypothetical protein
MLMKGNTRELTAGRKARDIIEKTAGSNASAFLDESSNLPMIFGVEDHFSDSRRALDR